MQTIEVPCNAMFCNDLPGVQDWILERVEQTALVRIQQGPSKSGWARPKKCEGLNLRNLCQQPITHMKP